MPLRPVCGLYPPIISEAEEGAAPKAPLLPLLVALGPPTPPSIAFTAAELLPPPNIPVPELCGWTRNRQEKFRSDTVLLLKNW